MNEEPTVTEAEAIQRPEFDGGTFTIDFLSDNPAGFKIRTRKSLPRHEPNTPLPFAERIAHQREGEKKELRTGKEFKPKLGVRNIELQGNELIMDIMPVTFPTYLAISSPELSDAEKEISNPNGTALILLTTEDDGSSKVVIQHRSAKNSMYGDIPGASAAGMLDGKLDLKGPNRGRLQPIDDVFIKRNIDSEMHQEIGLQPGDISDLRITGFASDKRRVHNEFLLIAKTKLSSKDLDFRSGIGDYFRFSEKFFTIDGTPEAIETLLTQVKCPLPPTHAAAFIAAAYSMILEAKGVNEAERWKRRMEENVKRNYQEIDEAVREYYIENPYEVKNVPERKPARKLDGYEPAYGPQEQGIPSLESELERVGLKSEKRIRKVDEILVFDVDGVITEPSGRMFDPEIMYEIKRRLEIGEPVILNTGRSISWVQSQIIARLYHTYDLKDVSSLQNLFVVGEKGGSWMTFDEKGMMQTHIDGNITLPQELQRKINQLIADEFFQTMFYDTTKHTMVTAEMKPLDPQRSKEEQEIEFKKNQIELERKITAIIEEANLSDSIRVDTTTIATDVEDRNVGKDFAMQRVVAWLNQIGVDGRRYLTFGDSESDIKMAIQLHDDGKEVEFIYVGNKPLEGEFTFPVTTTNGKFNKGTVEYLQGH